MTPLKLIIYSLAVTVGVILVFITSSVMFLFYDLWVEWYDCLKAGYQGFWRQLHNTFNPGDQIPIFDPEEGEIIVGEPDEVVMPYIIEIDGRKFFVDYHVYNLIQELKNK